MMCTFPYCQYETEADKMSCFVGIFSIEAHLADVVLHAMGYGVFKG